jgi:hypothetical protein
MVSIEALRDRAEAVRDDLDRASFPPSIDSEEDCEHRIVESRRLIALAEELYERANELVKRAEALWPPADQQLPETVE